MQSELEIGSIVKGTVTGMVDFGAFVKLPDGSTGLVHISEVSPSYVQQVQDHLKDNQEVNVKILKIEDINGRRKIALSIRQAMENQRGDESTSLGGRSGDSRGSEVRQSSKHDAGFRGDQRDSNRGWDRKPSKSFGRSGGSKGNSFEDMMARFKKSSEEKLSDFNRASERKCGKSSRRGGAAR